MKFREDPHQASGGYGTCSANPQFSQDPRLRRLGTLGRRYSGISASLSKKNLFFESTIRRRAISWAAKYRGGTERSGDSAPRVKFSRSFPPHCYLIPVSWPFTFFVKHEARIHFNNNIRIASPFLCSNSVFQWPNPSDFFFQSPSTPHQAKIPSPSTPQSKFVTSHLSLHIRFHHPFRHDTCKHSTSNPLPLHLHFIHLTNLPLLFTSIHPSYPSRQALSSSPHRHTSPHPPSAPLAPKLSLRLNVCAGVLSRRPHPIVIPESTLNQKPHATENATDKVSTIPEITFLCCG